MFSDVDHIKVKGLNIECGLGNDCGEGAGCDQFFFGHNQRVLICPFPRTTNFSAVSSSRPMGPKAWSFVVEMPISAPRPNCPPSLKRVEQFHPIMEESKAWINFLAVYSLSVTMTSV